MKKFLIFVGLLLAATATLAGLLFLAYDKDIQTPVGGTGEKVFTVEAGEGASAIGKRLQDEGLINSTWSFVVYLEINDLTHQIKAGTYVLSPAKSAAQIISILTSGDVASRKVTIPEGLRTSEVAKLFDKNEVVKAGEFEAALKKSEYQFAFLKEIPNKQGLEGYLFPDTYFLPYEVSAKEVVEAMLANFESKITPEMRLGFEKQGLTLHEAVTLASIVELEASGDSDRKIVAAVLLNRLKIGMKLQVDATINFITGKNKRSSSLSDLKIDSPYNTYLYEGLPPGPIASPGAASISAVANPAKTDYLFYCHDKDGKAYYGRTDADHQRNRLSCLR